MAKELLIKFADVVGVGIAIEGGGLVEAQVALLHQPLYALQFQAVDILHQGGTFRPFKDGAKVFFGDAQMGGDGALGEGLVDMLLHIAFGALGILLLPRKGARLLFAVALVDGAK